MKNLDVREKVSTSGVRMWQIAEKLKIADTTLCRKLRKELSADEKRKIFAIIDELAAG